MNLATVGMLEVVALHVKLGMRNFVVRYVNQARSQLGFARGGGRANIYYTYIYTIHVFRGGTESNFTSPGGPCLLGPLGYGPDVYRAFLVFIVVTIHEPYILFISM